jgi:predicted outer membrane repeat protein
MMKKTRIQAIVFVISLLALGGCSNLLLEKSRASTGPETASSDIPEGFGTVQVSLTRGEARTVIPDPVELDTLHLEYWFAKNGGSAEKKNQEGDGIFILEAGTYTLTVKGLLTADDSASLAAQGTADASFTIVAGTNAGAVNVTLRPITGEGAGALEFGLQYPAGTTVEVLTLTRIAGDEIYDLMNPAPVISGADPLTLSGSKTNIPVGYYLLQVTLKNSSGTTAKSEVVHIYRNLTAETALARYTFTPEDFSAYLVTNTNDSGQGSLYQALIDVPAGQTIGIMLEPGSIITLQSVLPQINKNIIIEGNGVTLTRAASWTASETSQLLYVNSSSAVVKISRVHFKDGRATNYGGAIRNIGTLTLESCIFSGNQTTGTSAYGGAIYSTNALTIKGSTFYRNTAGEQGGAVYFTASGKTLTLTGNVFYGNVALTYPVVRVNSGTPSASYNVVDVNFGTGNTLCGWVKGTGDKPPVATLPLSGKTFKLLGSGAGSVITALLMGYPTADFYGESIGTNAAAGAVQATAESGYYIELSVNNSQRGSATVSLPPDEDGVVSGSYTLTATVNSGYVFSYWVVNDAQITGSSITLSQHARAQAVFFPSVNLFTDGANSATTPGTLRYALTNSQDGDVINFSGVTPGTTVIKLQNTLPAISKSITVEGNGITLTYDGSGPVSATSQLLYVSNSSAVVTISRMHFKDGWATNNGGAIRNTGTLTLSSCIFSGNKITGTSAYGGAIHSDNTLTIKGCTFYTNTAGEQGGVVYFSASGKILTLTGNVFYGNVAPTYPVVRVNSGTASASYNVVDVNFGTENTRCGWTQGTKDKWVTTLPLLPKTFKLLLESEAAGVISTPPAGYPTTDFYGDSIGSSNAAAGAVQSDVNGYYLILSGNSGPAGTVGVSPTPNGDGIVSGPFALTATPKSGYVFGYWLVNNVRKTNNPLNLSENAQVQAVFNRIVTVNSFTDGSGSATTQGTLRYALTNAQDSDIISFSGVTPGTTVIELRSALPVITKNVIIEGNGVTLTRSASWTASETSQLLYINSNTAAVKISRIHFKNGLAADYGGAIRNTAALTLESCVFSGNRTTSISGAIYSSNTLTLRGCTFYGDTSDQIRAVYFSASGKILSLTGNLFYGTAGGSYSAVFCSSGTTVSASYNVVDTNFGWTKGPGDKQVTGPSILPKTFKLLPESESAVVIATRPEDYPTTDFYGDSIGSSNAAAGAVQTYTTGSGYYLDLSVNNSLVGTIGVSPQPDENGFVSGSFTITASPKSGYALNYWLVNGVKTTSVPTSLSSHTLVQAVFGRAITVNSFTDGSGSATTQGTLRYALTNAQDWDIISFNGATAGTTVIELRDNLPGITKHITIAGNGVILTRAASWTTVDSSSQLLYINSSAEVKISRVHFKNGLASTYGGAIQNYGNLTLESCIFSDNQTTSTNAYGGAIYSKGNILTIRGCTFYRNTSGNQGGAIYNDSNRSLILTGNLFYGNTALRHPVMYENYSEPGSISYNVVDTAFGTAIDRCGWAQGTGDKPETTPLTSGRTFKLLSGSGARNVIDSLLEDYPATDFYGASIGSNAAAGAVQGSTTGSGYYLELSVNNSTLGTVGVSPSLDDDGLVSGSFTITASPKSGYGFGYWLVNGVQTTSAPTSLSKHTFVQAVFGRLVTVNSFTDAPGSATTQGTLRYALTNAQDWDIINFSGVTAGTTVIELESALPEITNRITIAGNGVTLTRAASWTTVNNSSQLLYITVTAEVKLSGVHFKNGLVSTYGGAICNYGTLTLESCIFSNNKSTVNGGAIYSENTLIIRGCTFYGNTSAWGGAVYFRALTREVLTLTGNIFHANGASNIPTTVFVSSSSNAVISSYNVVAGSFGTGSTGCGWAQGTGDKTLTALGISSDPFNTTTFAPVIELKSVIPSAVPAGFPATDFRGQTRTFPGAPGAVK